MCVLIIRRYKYFSLIETLKRGCGLYVGDYGIHYGVHCLHCLQPVEPCIVYTTRQLLPAAKKDVLPAFHQSNIVYQFLCHCNSRYVGHTSQRLQQRIKQHMPKTILQDYISQNRSTLARSCKPIRSFKAETSFSAIGQHLLQNPTCHVNIFVMITNFLFLPVALFLFIFPSLKPQKSKHPNQIYANKRISFMV